MVLNNKFILFVKLIIKGMYVLCLLNYSVLKFLVYFIGKILDLIEVNVRENLYFERKNE